MIEFKIKSNGQWDALDVEAYPQLTDTLDESFDTCQIVLKRNLDPNPIQADREIRAIDGDLIRDFVIMSDQVTVTSSYQQEYRHTLTLAQNISKWKKYLIRNQVFSQPPKDAIYGRVSMAIVNDGGYVNRHWHPYSQTIPFDGHMRISEAQQRWYFRATYWDDLNQRYVNQPITGTPKGEIILEATNGIRVNVGNVSSVLGNLGSNSWGKITDGKYINALKNLSKYGAVKIIFRSGYSDYDQSFQSIPTDQQHPLALITFSYEVKVGVHYFTMKDVLGQLRESCAQYVDDEARKPIPFDMPAENGTLDNLLKDTIAPNFTWTQSTLYDALADFFSYYDAIMTLDSDNRIGMEEMKANGESIDSKTAGYSSASSSDERANGMINFYSRAKREISVPDTKGNFMGLRTAELGVPSSEGFSITLPDPIDHITKCEIIINEFTLSNQTSAYKPMYVKSPMIVDITDRIIERSLWYQLDKDQWISKNRRYDKLYQFSAIPYDKGSKTISMSGVYQSQTNITTYFLEYVLKDALCGFLGFGEDKETMINGSLDIEAEYLVEQIDSPSIGSWKDIKVRVEYVAQTDGKVRSESTENKIDREIIATQGSADCDMGKLGKSMKGLLERTGNDTRSVTFEVSEWSDAPKKGMKDGEWIANKVDYRITPDGRYIAVAEMSKNFNRMSMRTKIDRTRRMSNVSDDLVQDCEDILTEYVYLSADGKIESSEIAIGSDALREMVGNTFPASASSSKSVDLAVCEPYDSNGSNIIANVMIPMRKYAFNNCVCFEMRYDSPMSAGNRLTVSTGWFGYSKYYSTPVIYADKAGFFDKVDIKLKSATGEWASDMPMVDTTMTQQVGMITDYKYMKKPNERFGLNYEICFLTDPRKSKDDFIYGQAFFENNGLIKPNAASVMRVYYDSETPFGDGQIEDGKYVEVEVIYLNGEPNRYRIRCQIEQDYVSNWALADREGNVYIACNIPHELDDGDIVFYLTPSKWRL